MCQNLAMLRLKGLQWKCAHGDQHWLLRLTAVEFSFMPCGRRTSTPGACEVTFRFISRARAMRASRKRASSASACASSSASEPCEAHLPSVSSGCSPPDHSAGQCVMLGMHGKPHPALLNTYAGTSRPEQLCAKVVICVESSENPQHQHVIIWTATFGGGPVPPDRAKCCARSCACRASACRHSPHVPMSIEAAATPG